MIIQKNVKQRLRAQARMNYHKIKKRCTRKTKGQKKDKCE